MYAIFAGITTLGCLIFEGISTIIICKKVNTVEKDIEVPKHAKCLKIKSYIKYQIRSLKLFLMICMRHRRNFQDKKASDTTASKVGFRIGALTKFVDMFLHVYSVAVNVINASFKINALTLTKCIEHHNTYVRDLVDNLIAMDSLATEHLLQKIVDSGMFCGYVHSMGTDLKRILSVWVFMDICLSIVRSL